MKKAFLSYINKLFKPELENLYGKNSFIEITQIIKTHQNQNYIINCKLFLSNLDFFKEVGDDGLKYLFHTIMQYMGLDKNKFIIIISYEII